MTILGALLGGALVFRIGAARLLAPAVFLIAASNLTFSWLALVGQPDLMILTVAISVDNLVGGMSGSIFIAFLSGLTNTAYTGDPVRAVHLDHDPARQAARRLSGWVVDRLQEEFSATHKFGGYAIFFVYTALARPARARAGGDRRAASKKKPLLPEGRRGQ